MSAVTVSVGGRSRSLAARWVLAAGLAAAAILIALGLVAGRWTAPAPSAVPAQPTLQDADPAPRGGGRAAPRTADYRCAVGRPC